MMRRVLLGFIAFMLIFQVGCGGSFGRGFERIFVSPTRSLVTALDGLVRIQIPSNAFQSDVVMLFASLLNLPTVPLLILNAIDFRIDGGTPSAPLTTRIEFDPSTLPTGTSPSDLRIFRVEGETEVEIPGSRIVEGENAIEADLVQDGVYVVGIPEDVVNGS